jgi:hypothetical protein
MQEAEVVAAVLEAAAEVVVPEEEVVEAEVPEGAAEVVVRAPGLEPALERGPEVVRAAALEAVLAAEQEQVVAQAQEVAVQEPERAGGPAPEEERRAVEQVLELEQGAARVELAAARAVLRSD